VALARTLAYDSELVLLDEPFRGLDAETKEKVSALILEETKGKTLLFVTHDEADLALCDEIVRMDGAPVSRMILEKSGNVETE
jgi:ABC-type transport system involved in cytochrome bd biosynthesis fused ATPase/permease subunit